MIDLNKQLGEKINLLTYQEFKEIAYGDRKGGDQVIRNPKILSLEPEDQCLSLEA